MSLIDKYSSPARTTFKESRKLICPTREAQAVADEVARSGEWVMVRFPESFEIVNAVVAIDRPIPSPDLARAVADAAVSHLYADPLSDRSDLRKKYTESVEAYRAAKGAK